MFRGRAGYPAVMDDKRRDTVSDPAHADDEGRDWSTEGGATHEGPATDTDDDTEPHADADSAPDAGTQGDR